MRVAKVSFHAVEKSRNGQRKPLPSQKACGEQRRDNEYKSGLGWIVF
jgi:hypothetical protein